MDIVLKQKGGKMIICGFDFDGRFIGLGIVVRSDENKLEVVPLEYWLRYKKGNQNLIRFCSFGSIKVCSRHEIIFRLAKLTGKSQDEISKKLPENPQDLDVLNIITPQNRFPLRSILTQPRLKMIVPILVLLTVIVFSLIAFIPQDQSVKLNSAKDSFQNFELKDLNMQKIKLPKILPIDTSQIISDIVISSNFGPRKNPFGGGELKFHFGTDFLCPIGTAVKATADGKVIYAGWYGQYGNLVVINHGQFATFYGHLKYPFKVRKGQKVKEGQIIAFSGKSGKCTGPHLHYEIRVDPLLFIEEKPKTLMFGPFP